jgi:hypothetical protein
MSATISAQTDVLCSGTAAVQQLYLLTRLGTLWLFWNTIPVQTSAAATNLAIGTYTATITDVNGCTTTTQIIIRNQTV